MLSQSVSHCGKSQVMYGGIDISFQTFVPPHRHTIVHATANPNAAPAPRRPPVRIFRTKLNRLCAEKGCCQGCAARCQPKPLLQRDDADSASWAAGRVGWERSNASWLGKAQGAYSISAANAGNPCPAERRFPTNREEVGPTEHCLPVVKRRPWTPPPLISTILGTLSGSLERDGYNLRVLKICTLILSLRLLKCHIPGLERTSGIPVRVEI